LETYDEYFSYAEKAFPPQGFWNIYGIGLPDEVLRKIYHENAARLIPGVKEKLTQRRPSNEQENDNALSTEHKQALLAAPKHLRTSLKLCA
jgi:hypothetical protein